MIDEDIEVGPLPEDLILLFAKELRRQGYTAEIYREKGDELDKARLRISSRPEGR